jgi:Mn-containing catalase
MTTTKLNLNLIPATLANIDKALFEAYGSKAGELSVACIYEIKRYLEEPGTERQNWSSFVEEVKSAAYCRCSFDA